MVYSLVFVRILAIVLIVNEHLSSFYPDPRFAWGGYIGNGLFYLISGYGLTLTQMRKPLNVFNWYKKRLLKILIPFLFYIFVLHFGDWAKIIWTIKHNLIITSVEQLGYFFGVLWILYLLFLPLNQLSTKNLIRGLGLFAGYVLISMIFKIQQIEGVVPKNLATTELNFLYSGIICFMLGMISARKKVDQIFSDNPRLYGLLAVVFILGTQILHRILYKINDHLIFFNFFLSIMCIFGVYMLFSLPWTHIFEKIIQPLHAIAGSSLAVYFVHFFMMKTVAHLGIAFPYNVIAVFMYSFIFAYPLTRIAVAISDWVLGGLDRMKREN